MKKSFIFLSILFFVFIIGFSSKLYSQCISEMNLEEFTNYKQHLDDYYRTSSVQRLTETSISVPVTIHVIRKSNGIGGVDLSKIFSSINVLNEQFSNAGIHFYLCGNINYINSNLVYDYSDIVETSKLSDSYNVPNTINIVWYNTIRLSDLGNAGGFTTFPGGPLRISMSSLANIHSLTHEMGHFWGLPHTFQYSDSKNASLRELVTRGPLANCSTAGDGICDTPADPFIPNKSNSNYPECVYTEKIFDANNEQYSPMLNNTMSYYYGCQNEEFTPGQYDVIKSYKNSPYRSNWSSSCIIVDAPTNLTAVVDPKYGIKLNWKDNANNEIAYQIEVSENNNYSFKSKVILPSNSTNYYYGDIKSNTVYYFRIKPINGNETYSNIVSARTQNTYCIPLNFYSCRSNYIFDDVPISIGIRQVSLNGETILNNISECSTNSYDFYNSPVTKIFKEMPYRLVVDIIKNNVIKFDPDVVVWIDLDNDGQFDDKNEKYILKLGAEYSLLIRLPDSIASGIKRMRVRTTPTRMGTNILACSQIEYGETEDYLIDVQSKPTYFPVVVNAQYNALYKGKLVWVYEDLPSDTKCYVYGRNDGMEYKLLDSVILGQNSVTLLIKENGINSYFLRKASDHSIISNIDSITVNDIVYCVPDYTYPCSNNGDNAISNVMVAGEVLLNNASQCSNQSFDFYPNQFTSLYPGIPYSIEVEQLHQPNLNVTPRKVAAWIDLDDNGSFDDTEIIQLNKDPKLLNTYTGKIIVPIAASPGTKTMRIKMYSGNSLPCSKDITGETEDYKVLLHSSLFNMPVKLTVKNNSVNSASVSWTYTNLSDNTPCYLYRSYSKGDIRKIDSMEINKNSSLNLLSGNGEYKFWIRRKSNNSIISNVATINIYDYVKPIKLYASLKDDHILVDWNTLNINIDKALLYKASSSNASSYQLLDTVVFSPGFYSDKKVLKGDTDYKYILMDLYKDTLSNIADVKFTNQVCKPSFENTACLADYYTYVSYESNGQKKQLLNNPFCIDKNQFIEPDLFDLLIKTDTLYRNQMYTFNASIEKGCIDNLPDYGQILRNIKIWIDFDNNGSFSADEIVLENDHDVKQCSLSANFLLSDKIPSGLKRLRCIITDGAYPIYQECGSYKIGSGFEKFVFISSKNNIFAMDKQLSETLDVKIFPNPALNGEFSIESTKTVEKIRISNITGKVIYEGSPKGINYLPAGFYLFDIFTIGQPIATKLKFISE